MAFRSSALVLARIASSRCLQLTYTPCARHMSTSRILTLRVPAQLQPFRSAQSGTIVPDAESVKKKYQSRKLVEDRVMELIGLHEGISKVLDKLSLTSDFIEELGLDSLDHVEIVMAMEDEFFFEIPDEDAEKLRSPGDIVQYICDRELQFSGEAYDMSLCSRLFHLSRTACPRLLPLVSARLSQRHTAHYPTPAAVFDAHRNTQLVIKRFGGADHFAVNREMIEDRIMMVLNLCDKINPKLLNVNSHFVNDLGLDSLDRVELFLELEDEFSFEFPDDHTDRMHTPGDVVQYICDKWDVFD